MREVAAEQRPPFNVRASASIEHLNIRKEGPEGEEEVACDVKLTIKKVDWRLCDYFDPALAPFLWKQDTESWIVRSDKLGPISYSTTVEGATIVIGNEQFTGDAKKFQIVPKDGGVIDLLCSVTIRPNDDEVSALAKDLKEDVGVSIQAQPDLFAQAGQR